MQKKLTVLVKKAEKNNGSIYESDVTRMFSGEQIEEAFEYLEKAGIDILADEETEELDYTDIPGFTHILTYYSKLK